MAKVKRAEPDSGSVRLYRQVTNTGLGRFGKTNVLRAVSCRALSDGLLTSGGDTNGRRSADALFVRNLERLVVEGVRLPVEELAGGEHQLAGALERRIGAFRRIDEALSRGAEPLTGRSLVHYRIIEKLGAGGMGHV